MPSIQMTKPKPGFRLNLTHPLSRGLVGWWLFNEGGGSRLFDQSINSNDGTLTNMSTESGWISSPRGGSLDFDGSNDYVTMGNKSSLNPSQGLTIVVWVYLDTIVGGTDNGVLAMMTAAASGAYYLERRGGVNQWEWALDTSTGLMQLRTVAGTADTGKWHHIVCTYDGVNARIYLNGIENVSQAKTGNIDSTSQPFVLGWYSDASAANPIDGKLDDVRIYNRALSPSEVLEVYSNPYANVLRQNTTKRRLFHALWLAKQRDRLFSKVNGGLAR